MCHQLDQVKMRWKNSVSVESWHQRDVKSESMAFVLRSLSLPRQSLAFLKNKALKTSHFHISPRLASSDSFSKTKPESDGLVMVVESIKEKSRSPIGALLLYGFTGIMFYTVFSELLSSKPSWSHPQPSVWKVCEQLGSTANARCTTYGLRIKDIAEKSLPPRSSIL